MPHYEVFDRFYRLVGEASSVDLVAVFGVIGSVDTFPPNRPVGYTRDHWGEILEDGRVYDWRDNGKITLGFVEDSGRVFDARRNVVGSVERFGSILDKNGTRMGWIKVDSEDDLRAGNYKIMAAGALLLLLGVSISS